MPKEKPVVESPDKLKPDENSWLRTLNDIQRRAPGFAQALASDSWLQLAVAKQIEADDIDLSLHNGKRVVAEFLRIHSIEARQ